MLKSFSATGWPGTPYASSTLPAGLSSVTASLPSSCRICALACPAAAPYAAENAAASAATTKAEPAGIEPARSTVRASLPLRWTTSRYPAREKAATPELYSSM